MKACNDFRSLMVEVAGGAAGEGDRLRLEEHMSMCEGCSQEFSRLTAVVDLTKAGHAEPGDAFWTGYYGRLQTRMEAEDASAVRRLPGLSDVLDHAATLLRAPRWALQIAVAVLLVASGILIGRSFFATESSRPEIASIPEEPGGLQSAALETRAHAYLDRSKTLLLGLVNFDLQEDDPGALNIDRRRQMAGDLISEASLLQKELTANDQRRLSELISDLEVILLQIANIETTYDVPEIEMVQSGVDRKAILFKIEVEAMRRQTGAASGGTSADVNSSI